MAEEIERIRSKAHMMLRQKDKGLRRQKQLIDKYHQCLRDHDMTDEQIKEFVYLSDTEFQDSASDSSDVAGENSYKLDTTQNTAVGNDDE